MSNCVQNYYAIKKNIEKACLRVGRDPKEVTLIAVSKTKPLSMIQELLPEGVVDFGENKPQELKEKCDALLSQKLNWHMIGHLQRNKVKYVVGRCCMIHAIESLRLAEAVEEEAAKQDMIVPVLVEVNVAKEESKFGLYPEDVADFIRTISTFVHIKVKGLMTIAPFVENAEENRVHFRNLYNLFVDIKEGNIDNIDMCILSMGMTGDYEVAVEEGATHVRVGTGIFGER